ncbi:unnamed protein product [Cuscuta europaea]|uniref:Leucine-rich repeat-containing N-terminal plant-type domain-containing protein n=1 Tax=Cuscuta europaea TaxID=41803 RepID=A0A9P1E4X0_CUSEU|nr:unnamed protein product [Cuscuta europaea]
MSCFCLLTRQSPSAPIHSIERKKSMKQEQAARRVLKTEWLLLLPLFLQLSFVFANHEGDVLHTLKEKLEDPNNVLQSWDPTLVNPCTWFHITCNSNNEVTRIDLGNSSLSGELISTGLGGLSSLQYLELYSNSIYGSIPSDLGKLTNLISLDLYYNQLSGTIPGNWGNLTNLRFLDFSDNSLSGTITLNHGVLQKLTCISFMNNQGLECSA